MNDEDKHFFFICVYCLFVQCIFKFFAIISMGPSVFPIELAIMDLCVMNVFSHSVQSFHFMVEKPRPREGSR